MNCILGHRLLSFLLLMLLACTRRRHSRHAKPYPKVILERRKHGECELHSGPPIALLPTAHASCLHPQAPQSACQTIRKVSSERRKHLFGSPGGVNCILGYRLLSVLLLMLLACTRRRHSRHAKPYPKVCLERRKHLFRPLGESAFWATDCSPSYCLCFLLAPAGATGSVNCILGHRLLSFLLLMLLACTRRRHSRHAKPYPKVILERRKHLFRSV